MRRMFTSEGIKKLIDEEIQDAFDNIEDLDVAGDLDVANKIKVVSFDKIVDEDNNKLSDQYLFENIVDKDGHKRFVDGAMTPQTIEGVTINYSRWSLSGTHIMLVVSGSIEAGTSLTFNQELARATLPEWIGSKIVPTVGADIPGFNIMMSPTGYNAFSTLPLLVSKFSDTVLRLGFGDTTTINTKQYFRLQVDLIIDNA